MFTRFCTFREFVRKYVLTPPNDDEEHDTDAAVLHLIDSHFSHLEAMSAEANVHAEIDFAESMHSFLTANMSSLAEIILRTNTDFGNTFRQRSVSFLARFTALCLRCFTDGHASLERVIRNRIEAISGDYGATLRDFVLSAAVAHFRNYLAGLEAGASQNEDVEQYLVRTGPDADQRKAARRRRLAQHQQAREEETFVTPRSSPPPPLQQGPMVEQTQPAVAMDVDTDTKDQDVIVDPPTDQGAFPTSVSYKNPFKNRSSFSYKYFCLFLQLSDIGNVDSTIAVGSQPWHGTLPSDWVPIVARDVHRQNGQEHQRPLSDAYLSTQSAKRRRIASRNKPEGNIEQLIADTLDTAIRVTGAQPVHAVTEVIQDASKQGSIQQSLSQDVKSSLSRRLSNDPDFDTKKFPNAKKFHDEKK